MRLLLDTCALHWMSSSPATPSAAARLAMADPEALLHFSSISALEIGIKVRNRKLTLPDPIATWFSRIVISLGLREVSLRSAIAIRAATVEWDHRDPADRVLVATAILEDMMIVTANSLIARFAPNRIIW